MPGFSNENSSYPRVWIAGIALEGVTSDSTAPAEFVSDTHIRITTTEVYGGLDPIRCITVRNSSDDSTLAVKDDAITVITATTSAPTITSVSPDTLTIGIQNTTIDIYGTGFSNENSSYPRVWIAGIALEGVTSDSTAPAEFVSDTHIRITTTEVYGGLDTIRCTAIPAHP